MVAVTSSELVRYVLAFFLLVVGLGLGWALISLGATFRRLAALIGGAERELLPVVNKVGGSVDRVNAQLDKVDHATDSAVAAVAAVDQVVRTLSTSIRRPMQKVAGFSGSGSKGFSTFRKRRDDHDGRAETQRNDAMLEAGGESGSKASD